MAESVNVRDSMSAEEVLQTEIIINQALIDILVAKQVITEEELVQAIKNIRRDQMKLLHGSSKIVSMRKRSV